MKLKDLYNVHEVKELDITNLDNYKKINLYIKSIIDNEDVRDLLKLKDRLEQGMELKDRLWKAGRLVNQQRDFIVKRMYDMSGEFKNKRADLRDMESFINRIKTPATIDSYLNKLAHRYEGEGWFDKIVYPFLMKSTEVLKQRMELEINELPIKYRSTVRPDEFLVSLRKIPYNEYHTEVEKLIKKLKSK